MYREREGKNHLIHPSVDRGIEERENKDNSIQFWGLDGCGKRGTRRDRAKAEEEGASFLIEQFSLFSLLSPRGLKISPSPSPKREEERERNEMEKYGSKKYESGCGGGG